MHVSLSLSLSLSIYIYIHIQMYAHYSYGKSSRGKSYTGKVFIWTLFYIHCSRYICSNSLICSKNRLDFEAAPLGMGRTTWMGTRYFSLHHCMFSVYSLFCRLFFLGFFFSLTHVSLLFLNPGWDTIHIGRIYTLFYVFVLT